MIKLPDPAAPSRWKGDPALYSEDQVKQTIRDALEEAAQLCDSEASAWENNSDGQVSVQSLADAIRALKETI